MDRGFWSAAEEDMEATNQMPQKGQVTCSVSLHTATGVTETSLAYTT